MALTKATLIDLNSNELVLDLDADTSITADTDDTIHFKIAGSDEITMTATALAPSTSDGQALGTSSLMFSDLFLASGSVLNFNNGDVTLTHASNLLTLDGGSLDLDGESLILDADGDTKLVESSDDVIDLVFAGVTGSPVQFGAGYISLKNQGSQSYIRFYCESSNAHYIQLQAPAHSDFSGNGTVTLPVATSTLATTSLSETLTNKTLTSPDINTSIELLARAEARFQDASGGQFVALEAPATVSSSFVLTLPAADGSSGQFLKTDGSGALSFDSVSSAADDISTGDAAVTLATSAGNITIDAQGNDTDIIFKGTDGSSDTTFLTLDGSDAGTAIFNHDIKIADDGQIGSASAADAMIISSGGIVTFKDDIKIKDGGTIGTASDADAITIAAAGSVTLSQAATITVADNSDTLTLKSTDADASSGPVLNLVRDSASPADGDSIGRINFTGDNDAGESETFVRLKAAIVDASNGSEDGQLRISRMIAGGDQNVLSFLDGETVVNDDSKDLDFRVESDNDANALFVQGSDGHVGLGLSAPEARLHIFDGDASVGPNANGDELVVEDNDNCGISILSANNAYGSIFFGDSGDDDIGQIRYDHDNNRMSFFANAQERMRITSSGEIGINEGQIDTGGIILKVSGAQNNTVCRMIHKNTTTTDETAIDFRDGDIQQCGRVKINASGNSVTYLTSSDYRLKENEVTLTGGITRLKNLKPRRFNFISDPDNTMVDGFFAHEAATVVPEAVGGSKDETETIENGVFTASGNEIDKNKTEAEWTKGKAEGVYPSDSTWSASRTIPKYQGIDESRLVPLLTAALQEAVTKIEALEARVTTLEG